MLDHARIEQDRKRYGMEPSNLAALVETTAKLMEPQAHQEQIQIKLSLPDTDDPELEFTPSIDAAAIQQTLVNLLDNAIKFSPADSTIEVGLEFDPPNSNGAHGTTRI